MQELQLYNGSLDLNTLPALLTKSKAITAQVKQATEPVIAEIKAKNLQTEALQGLDALEVSLAQWIAWAKNGYESVNNGRTPFTKAFAEVTSTFTAEEKVIAEVGETFKGLLNSVAAEKGRRIREDQERLQKEADRVKAVEAYKRAVTDAINAAFYPALRGVLDNMNMGFYAGTQDTMPEVLAKLKAYAPQFAPYPYEVYPNPLLSGEEMLQIRATTDREVFATKADEWLKKVIAERDRLIELVPSRIAELQRIATDAAEAQAAAERQANEALERANEMAAMQSQAATKSAEAEQMGQMNHMFETAALAPAVTKTKGTTEKLKYVVTTHNDIGRIMQFWVKNNMPLLTIEDLTKKLSFMITAANQQLNKGEAIEGIATETDYSVRTTKTPKKSTAA